MALFLANLSVHRTNLARERMDQLKILPVYNVSYSPEFNGIENYWAQVKKVYKGAMLERVTQDQIIDIRGAVVEAIMKVPQEVTKNAQDTERRKYLRLLD